LKQATPFNAEFQDLITRYAWGEIWTRNVLDDRTRPARRARDADRAEPMGMNSRCT
jgi:hypothetical protein